MRKTAAQSGGGFCAVTGAEGQKCQKYFPAFDTYLYVREQRTNDRNRCKNFCVFNEIQKKTL